MMVNLLTWLRERPALLKCIFGLFLFIALIFDFLTERHHPHFWGDHVPGFFAVFALIGCLAMIVICKGISHSILERDEDYYER